MSMGFFNKLVLRSGSSHHIKTCNYVEALTDEGKYYGSSPIVSVGASSSSYLLVITRAGHNTHFYLSFTATGEATVNTYFNSTITNNGTAAGVAGFNLTKPFNFGIQIFTGTTVSAEGSIIADFLIPGGSGQQSVGANVSNPTKVIAGPSTQFLFKLINGTPQPIRISPAFSFYEEAI